MGHHAPHGGKRAQAPKPGVGPLAGGQGKVFGHGGKADGNRLDHHLLVPGQGAPEGYQAAGVAQAAVAAAGPSGPGLQKDAILPAAFGHGPAVVEQGGHVGAVGSPAAHHIGGCPKNAGDALNGHHVVAGGKGRQAKVVLAQHRGQEKLVQMGGVVDQIQHPHSLLAVFLQLGNVGHLAPVRRKEAGLGIVLAEKTVDQSHRRRDPVGVNLAVIADGDGLQVFLHRRGLRLQALGCELVQGELGGPLPDGPGLLPQ